VPSNSSIINTRGFWAPLDLFSFEREFGIIALVKKAKNINEFDSEREFGTALIKITKIRRNGGVVQVD